MSKLTNGPWIVKSLLQVRGARQAEGYDMYVRAGTGLRENLHKPALRVQRAFFYSGHISEELFLYSGNINKL